MGTSPDQRISKRNYSENKRCKNVCSFDVTFTPLSGVFGGACEKYIPLSVMEGLEVGLQLDNIANVLKYEFTPFPISDAGGPGENMNVSALRSSTKAAVQLTLNSSSGKWHGKIQLLSKITCLSSNRS